MTRADWITLGWLCAYLPVVFTLHALLYRAAPALRRAPAQGPAFRVAAGLVLVFLAGIAGTLRSDPECASHLVFGLLGLGFLASFYFLFLALSESGRRYFLLTLLEREGRPLSKAELADRYGRDYIIDVRLNRLVAWGAVEERDGRLYLKKYSFYLYCAFFHLWARALGFRWMEK